MSQPSSNDAAAKAAPYRVLARKYRPQSFADLIGQEPMVRTLTNAFESGRIAQAYLLTGVRGVGKTSTARILARALNYQLAGGPDRPSVDFTEPGEHCAAIIEGRHIDVIEMDAASHTGIGDIREIIEAVRYKPSIARYKVYIIDEVHMLSNQAFNGLLKTLEEPPEHVKFIFATTEVRKVPVTILSRCQRFDLRRIDADRLVALLGEVAAKENVAIAPDALAMLARAAEGSARDALSLFDQAIANAPSGDTIEADGLRAMLGLADRGRVIDLYETLMRGDAPAALDILAELHDVGADPAAVLEDLATFTHLVTRMKMATNAADDPSLTEEERTRGGKLSEQLSVRTLSRAWQMLLKGIDEAREASRPLAAADMVLVRIAHAADLPTPDEAIRTLRDGAPATNGGGSAASASVPAAPPPSAEARSSPAREPRMASTAAAAVAEPAPESAPEESGQPAPQSLDEVIALAAEKRDLPLKLGLERYVRLVKFEPGRIQMGLTPDAPPSFSGNLGKRLLEWTGRRWVITIDREATAETLFEKQAAAKAVLENDVRQDPVVAAVLSRFPGSEIVDIRMTGQTEPGDDPSIVSDNDITDEDPAEE